MNVTGVATSVEVGGENAGIRRNSLGMKTARPKGARSRGKANLGGMAVL
jgi:hypothetical protein